MLKRLFGRRIRKEEGALSKFELSFLEIYSEQQREIKLSLLALHDVIGRFSGSLDKYLAEEAQKKADEFLHEEETKSTDFDMKY